MYLKVANGPAFGSPGGISGFLDRRTRPVAVPRLFLVRRRRGLGLHQDYEQCAPIDVPCVNRNAQRQQEDMRERAETNRLAHLANCESNCALNAGRSACYCAQYGGSDYIPAGYQAPATPSTTYTPPPAGTPTPNPTVTPATATLTNVSRPGYGFQVGDSWQLVITGAPSQPVVATASQNGQSKGTTVFGNTDAAGKFVLSGMFAADTVGVWRQMWAVGSRSAPVIEFVIAAKPGTAAANGSGAGRGCPQDALKCPDGTVLSRSGPNCEFPKCPEKAARNNGNGAAADRDSLRDFIGTSFNVLGFDVPLWAAGLGVAGLAFAFSGRGRR